MEEKNKESINFIEEIVENDIKAGKHGGRIHTRFPPEPNGYLHIGHAKAICLNFELAKKYKGKTNLRFDDTNPVTEDVEYVESIKEDIRWLGYTWDNREYYASDYFQQLCEFAVDLVKKGKAYVDDSSSEEISRMRTIPTEPGIHSPFRERSVEENLALFIGMKEGKYHEGEKVLRAKIDMDSPNMHLRDPIIYRIIYTPHHRTGTTWCIYPMYDFAHGQSDSIEGITHSICTLEFENHRPLYNWFIEQLGIFPSRQIEFARLNLTYTVMSKRKLLQLVNDGHVRSWDDPRMPTISGFRRRGYTPQSIRNFVDSIGVARRENIIDVSLLEHHIREDLNKTVARVMAVLDPVKLIISNYEDGKTELLSIENNPEDPNLGERLVPFSKELYIDSDDFMEEAPKGYFRLTKGGMVRLKGAYIIQCNEVIKNANGDITELHCNYIPESKSGHDVSGLKVKGVIHWLSIAHAVPFEARVYDRLFTVEDPNDDKDKDFKEFINPHSLEILENCFIEPSAANAIPGNKFQFIRKAYFCVDPDSTKDHLVFNRTVTLKDTWNKIKDKH